MADTLTSDDPRYAKLFDVKEEASANGGQVFSDLTGAMCALRDIAPVQKGSLHHLLQLPEVGPGQYDTEREHYTLFSFENCDRAFRNNLLYSSEVYDESPGVRMMGDVILKMVGERHMNYRKLVQPMFVRPEAIKHWRPRWIEGAVKTLLDRIMGQDAVDLNLELCARLPVHIVTEGMGLGGAAALEFREHLLTSTILSRTLPQEQVAHSYAEVARMLNELIEARRQDPQDDVVSALVAAELEGEAGGPRQLTNEEIFSYCRLIMLAGGGTTWRQLGITLVSLLSRRHFWEACADNRDLIEPAIEEGARWLPTDPTFPRLLTEDVTVDGVDIPAGARVDLCLASANRDPARWDNPHEFDIHRPRQSHLAFGIGAHRCLGMEVAKQEMLEAINGLMDRFPNIALNQDAEAPVLMGGLHQRGYSPIQVKLV